MGAFATGLVSEGGWVLVARITAILVSVLALKILATALPAAELGRWSLFTGLVSLVSGVLSGALNQGLGRFVNDAVRMNALNDIIFRGIGLHLGLCSLAIVPVAVWWWVYPATFGATQPAFLGAVLLLASLSSVFLHTSGTLNTLRLRSGWAVSNLAEGAVRIGAIGLGVAWIGQTFWIPVGCAVLGALSGIGMALVCLKRAYGLQLWRGERFPMWNEVRWFSSPLIVVGLGWWFLGTINRYVINGCIGLEDVAQYAVATSIAVGIVGAIEGLTSAVTLPILYSQLPQSTDDEVRQRGAATAIVSAQAVLLATAGIPLLGAPLIRLLASDQYVSSAALVGGCVIVEWLRSLGGQLNASFYARRQTDQLVPPLAIAVVVQLMAGIPLIWGFGMWGAVAASCIVYLALFVSMIQRAPEVFEVAANWLGWGGRFAALMAAGGLLAFGLPSLASALPYGSGLPAAGLVLGLYGTLTGIALLSMRRVWEGMLAYA